MTLVFRDLPDCVREGERLGEVPERKHAAQPFDPVAFHEVPVGDLRLEQRELGVGDGRCVAAARDAPRPRKRFHLRILNEASTSRRSHRHPGSCAADRAIRPRRCARVRRDSPLPGRDGPPVRRGPGLRPWARVARRASPSAVEPRPRAAAPGRRRGVSALPQDRTSASCS